MITLHNVEIFTNKLWINTSYGFTVQDKSDSKQKLKEQLFKYTVFLHKTTQVTRRNVGIVTNINVVVNSQVEVSVKLFHLR